MEPYIISASRREDIPAFKAKWLLERLRDGFVMVSNSYSEYQVSFAKTKLFVFWSKNPKPLIPYIDQLPAPCYFQYTLNDYPEFEHKVPPLEERIDTFIELSEKIGKERVVWRFDPIIAFPSISSKMPFGVEQVLKRIETLGNKLHPYTEKLVFSFIDPYKKLGNFFEEVRDEDKAAIVEGLMGMNQNWGLKLATCDEGFSTDGIEHNKCVDPELAARICGDAEWINPAKDPKQRLFCGCMVSADIGAFHQCRHQCDYCYAK
jgi:hypothetical protein